MDLVLPERLRPALKKPFGELVPDLAGSRAALGSKYIIAVGDKVTETLLSMGVTPAVCLYDGKTRRKDIGVAPAIKEYNAREIRVRNPAGAISAEALRAIEDAIRSKEKTRILVDGEEDLLTLAAVKLAPENAIVIYGQPDAGAVLIKIEEKTRKKIEEILEEMKPK